MHQNYDNMRLIYVNIPVNCVDVQLIFFDIRLINVNMQVNCVNLQIFACLHNHWHTDINTSHVDKVILHLASGIIRAILSDLNTSKLDLLKKCVTCMST